MQKIYGYKESDVLGLIEYINKGEHRTLSQAFEDYAKISGKSKGTVRNLYYALAKTSREDGEFRKKYLGDKPVKVNPIVCFDKQEENKLVEDIEGLVAKGRSVRSAIIELSGGDPKLALRYQNKYRNAVKKSRVENNVLFKGDNERLFNLSDMQLKRLKGEINGLVERIAFGVRKENQKLHSRIVMLERENARLKNQLYLGDQPVDIKRFFVKKDGSAIIN